MNWGAVWSSVQERRHIHVDHLRLVFRYGFDTRATASCAFRPGRYPYDPS